MESEPVMVHWPVPLPWVCPGALLEGHRARSSFLPSPWRRDNPDTQAVGTPIPEPHLSGIVQAPGPVLPGPSISGQLSLGTTPGEGRANSSHPPRSGCRHWVML